MSLFLKRSSQLKNIFAASRRILRFSNASRNFELHSATPVLKPSACGSSRVFQRNLAKVAANYEHNEEQSRISDALPADEVIDQTLSKIDSDAKKFGQVLKKDVEAVFRQIKELGIVSSIQSLYLIRCCGSLLSYEPSDQRIAFAQEIWSKLEELAIPVDASHYNALLKVYLENEYNFSPPEFLASMECKGIAPNRVTYQRIIEKYCQEGDLSGASAILEHMKEKDLPINEKIFNSIVLGHARAKDMQGAVNMLDVMRKSQLEPSSETYTILACGFAESGDMEGFNDILCKAEEKEMYFSGPNYLQMVSSLAVAGNFDYIDQILGKVSIRQHKGEAVNTSLILTSKGFDEAAYKIISLLTSSDYHIAVYYFMRSLSVKEQALEKILKYCQDIYSQGFYEYVYEDALKAIVLCGKTEHAFELFQEMKKGGRPIRCHYFWPILSAYRKNGDAEGTWATLQFMTDMGIPADKDTYVDFVLPLVYNSCAESVISKVKEVGQSDATVLDALFIYLCTNGHIKAAGDIYREYKPQCNFNSIVNVLASNPHDDAESVVALLRQMKEGISDPDFREDFFGIFLNRLLSHHQKYLPLLEYFVREYDIQGIKLSTKFVEGLCSQLRSIAPELVRLVQNIEINVVRDQYIDTVYTSPSDMSLEELEKRLVHTKETGGNVRPLLRHLLTHYCRQKNLDRVLEIKAEMDAIYFTYSPTAYALLVNLFVSYNNLEEAMKYKKEIDEQFPHFKLDAAKAIDYITLMVKSDKADEVFEIIKNEAQEWVPPRYSDSLLLSIKKLLRAAAETGSVEVTHKLFQILVLDFKFAPVNHTTLEPLINVHLVRDDSDAAIEEYRKCALNYGVFPSRSLLFNKFITSNDPERLQKVVDISTTFGGKEIALHELAASFVASGRVQEARKVIQTLGTKADLKQLDIICYRFFKQDKVMELEHFIAITRDLYHIDRNQLYSHLLNIYIQHNEYQAGLEMWNAMQEENVQPSAVTLQRLADLLEKNDQPIPFVVPLSSEFQNNADLMKCLDQKIEVDAVNILRKMKKGEVHLLSPAVFTRIVDLFVEKRCLKEIVDMDQVMSCILNKSAEILKPVANKYGQAGDVASMKVLYDCMPDFAHRYMNFNPNMFEAYLVSGQPELLLDELVKNMNTSKNLFSSSGFLKLLQNFPELLDKAIKLADTYVEKENFDIPKVVIWLHYFLEEKYVEAENIYKDYAASIMRSDFPFVRILQAVRSSRNERLGRKLVDVANKTLKNNVKSRAYSCLLDVLVHNGKLEEAVALIEEANNDGVPTEKFLHPTLVSLQKSLAEKNMPVPFVITYEGKEDSSSSDDSD